MFQKKYFQKPKWGAQLAVRRARPPPPRRSNGAATYGGVGVANDAKPINVRVANKISKICNIIGQNVVLKVEYLWNGWVKKDGVNANLVLSDSPNFRYAHWFCL